MNGNTGKWNTIVRNCMVVTGLAMLAMGCGGNSTGQNQAPDLGSMRLSLTKLQTTELDSIVVRIEGSDMQSQRQVIAQPSQGTLTLEGIPPGPDRIFTVEAWRWGRKVQVGEAVHNVELGLPANLVIQMRSLWAVVTVDVGVGLGNPLGIAGGTMLVVQDTLRDSTVLQGTAPLLQFRSGLLQVGANTIVRMWLWNSVGDTVLTSNDTLLLRDSLGLVHWKLSSLVGDVMVDLQWADDLAVQAQALLPPGPTRRPQAIGEVIFTEMHPNPRTSGNDYEWVELYNGTLDTLRLDSCMVAKDRNTTASTTSFRIGADTRIPPAGFLVLGRDSVDFADVLYKDFTLSNTSQSVVLHCQGQLLDSLTYALPNDAVNPFPLEVAKTLQLNLEYWSSRVLGTSWCAGLDSATYATGLVYFGSPGWSGLCPAK